MVTKGKYHCPMCGFARWYKYWHSNPEHTEPAESHCELCGFTWQENRHHEQDDEFFGDEDLSIYVDEWRIIVSDYFKRMWLEPWLGIRAIYKKLRMVRL